MLYTHVHCYTAVPPPPPTNIRVVAVTDSSITVTWDLPNYSGAGNLTYKVYTSFDNRPRMEVLNVEISGRTATIPS